MFYKSIQNGIVLAVALIFSSAALATQNSAFEISSPDGRLAVEFHLAAGAPRYSIQLDGQPVLQESRLGLVRDY
ncbi:MAG TPA: glycoside hydrolase family 97 N-terminal domain-containing protein, partial [Verrucomicrobiae bacterium]|nr:glycoside hydrolase family 97 N-terminal domain-containing protein [Verrucomicrobiae bacterium]